MRQSLNHQNLSVFRQPCSTSRVFIYIFTSSRSTLTAVNLIRAVPAVVVGVAAPGVRDAALVGAGELIGQTRSRRPGGTVGLVAVVEAVVVAVAAPDGRHAALVGAGECRRGAGVV